MKEADKPKLSYRATPLVVLLLLSLSSSPSFFIYADSGPGPRAAEALDQGGPLTMPGPQRPGRCGVGSGTPPRLQDRRRFTEDKMLKPRSDR